MKQIYFLCFSLLLSISAAATPCRGYIVTKNGKHLTGHISGIFYTSDAGSVIFINDFGTLYTIHPALIKGFVLERGEQNITYMSRPSRQGWIFLRILYRGEGMSLYSTPEDQLFKLPNGKVSESGTLHANEFWIEMHNKPVSRIGRLSYKRKLRKLMEPKAPELAAKIGEKGYQFKDLMKVVQEFDKEISVPTWRL